MPTFGSPVTPSQCGDGLYELAIRSIVGVVVVGVARRGAVSASLLLLLLNATATVATLVDWCRRRRYIASLLAASHFR